MCVIWTTPTDSAGRSSATSRACSPVWRTSTKPLPLNQIPRRHTPCSGCPRLQWLCDVMTSPLGSAQPGAVESSPPGDDITVLAARPLPHLHESSTDDLSQPTVAGGQNCDQLRQHPVLSSVTTVSWLWAPPGRPAHCRDSAAAAARPCGQFGLQLDQPPLTAHCSLACSANLSSSWPDCCCPSAISVHLSHCRAGQVIISQTELCPSSLSHHPVEHGRVWLVYSSSSVGLSSTHQAEDATRAGELHPVHAGE